MPVLSVALPIRIYSPAPAPLDAPQVPLALGCDALETRRVGDVARAAIRRNLRIRADGPRERLARRWRRGARRSCRRASRMRALLCRGLLALLDPALERRQPVDAERAFAPRAVIHAGHEIEPDALVGLPLPDLLYDALVIV